MRLDAGDASAAFGIGEKGSEPYREYLNDIFCVTVNMAGLPAIAVPAGLVPPAALGVQLIGNRSTRRVCPRRPGDRGARRGRFTPHRGGK